MKKCRNCRHGIAARDPNDVAYVVCALAPPTPRSIMSVGEDMKLHTVVVWLRPSMDLDGWCGQFKLNVWKLFGGKGA